MAKPKLCTNHFYGVANYFDKRVAFEYEIDGDECLVCGKTINVEMARWFIQQQTAQAASSPARQPRTPRIQF